MHYLYHFGIIYLIIFFMLTTEFIAVSVYHAAREINGKIYPIAAATIEIAYVIWIFGIKAIKMIAGD